MIHSMTLAAQTRDTYGTSYLLVSEYSPMRIGKILSPFFQLKHCTNIEGRLNGRKLSKQTSRDIPISELMKVTYVNLVNFDPTIPQVDVQPLYDDGNSISYSVWTQSLIGLHSYEEIRQAITAAIIANAPSTMIESDIQFPLFDPIKTGIRSFSNPSLAVNTARRASTTRDAFVSATVDVTASLSLTTGQRGTLTLQYADDSAFTTNVKTAQASTNGNTGTLTIGLALGQTVSAAVSGLIPANKYYRLLTTNVTGTPTYGAPMVQEVLL